MGAGQIGGIATLLDIDFGNAAGFVGEPALPFEGHFMTYFFSHTMLFCAGALLEGHIVLTAASCVFGERYEFEVWAGTHKFLGGGAMRLAKNYCTHKGYNQSEDVYPFSVQCFQHNIAILVLGTEFSFHSKENLDNQAFPPNRVRYAMPKEIEDHETKRGLKCSYYGWGSRRNGFLVPILIRLQKVEVFLLRNKYCKHIPLNKDDEFLCLEHPSCWDDLGSVMECYGFARAIMISRIIDRPCGTGFLDLMNYLKFILCAIDDAREIMAQDSQLMLEHHKEIGLEPPPAVEVKEGGQIAAPSDELIELGNEEHKRR